LLSSMMMLQHMGLYGHAEKIQKAIFDTLADGKVCHPFVICYDGIVD